MPILWYALEADAELEEIPTIRLVVYGYSELGVVLNLYQLCHRTAIM